MNPDCFQTCKDIAVYRDIFNTLETAVLAYDEQGMLCHSNETARNLLSNHWGEIARFSGFIDFAYDYSIEVHEQGDLSGRARQERSRLAFSEIIGLGNHHYYNVRAMWHDGHIVVELFDVTEIKNRADHLAFLDRNNQILTEAIQSSQKGIFIARNGNENRIVFSNRAMDDLLARPAISLVGYDIRAFLSAEFPADWEEIDQVLQNKSRGSFWKKIEAQDGSVKWLHLSLFAEKTFEGGNLIIGFISDETQNKIRDGQLLQTQKLEAIGKLAGGVAHDFNNILSIVEGYIRLSESALRRGEDVSEQFGRIKQAVARGSGLTRQLLMFGKHRMSDNKVIDICAHLRDIETLLRPLLGVSIELSMNIPDAAIPVKATPDALSQIVMNLVINARDAMEQGGKILVSVETVEEEHASQIILRVKDTGCGMSKAVIEKIFDPFFTTKEQGKGTGLGLSMVYGLVQQVGGTINVDSVIGVGTEFTLSLPLAAFPQGHDLLAIKSSQSTGLDGKTILIAEDEPDLLEIMEATLADFGMKVLRASNGNEALAVQDEFEGRIDYLLTDMVMPELGGLKLAELVKEVRPETHIVYMSGYPVRGEIANIHLPQDAVFMAKPIKPEFLRSVLEDLSSGQKINPMDAMIWHS